MHERLMARSCSNNKLIFEDLYPFIEAKVKEVKLLFLSPRINRGI